MRLSSFIVEHKESILVEWEDFARSIQPSEAVLDVEQLRDHASALLDVIAADLERPQSNSEQISKSRGETAPSADSMAAKHADQRVESGFSVDLLVSEYRALRSSVLRLWAHHSKLGLSTDPEDIARFNEGIDQALAESVAQFSRLSQVALQESEARFRTITDAMPQMVWSTRPDGYHDYFNRGWFEFTGAQPHEADGTGWNEMFHPDDRERAWSAWRHSLATGEPYEIQYRLRHHSGEYRWTLGRALPVRGVAGEITRWMGTCTDIHDQKETEQELKTQMGLKDQFLAMLAHELRNPLAPISSAAQLLLMDNVDQHGVRQAGETIGRQVKHMTDLVDDLLDVSRVTRGLVELERVTVDVKDVVAHAIEQVRPLVEARRHQLHVRLASDVAIVQGDKGRLVQVLANLVTNAAKYTPQGGNLWVSVDVLRSTVLVEVKDDGSGITPELLPHVFELFSQGERTPHRSQGGLGLGLSLAKQIVNLHVGDIAAKSDGFGRGSVFTVSLPRAIDSTVFNQTTPETKGSGAAAPPVRVLIVDDNVDAGESLAALLSASGHHAEFAEDAEAALGFSRLGEMQAFILDIGLPGMDGYQLARRLRENPSTEDAILIALTGYGQAHDRVLSKSAGFDHHVVKPADTQALIALLSGVRVDRRRLPG